MKNRKQSASDNWETPDDLYHSLDRRYNFDFDPCPLHADFDGLSVEWGRRNFVNPPYSRQLKEAFVKKAIEEKSKGNLSVCLLPVSTSTVLFHDYIKPNADKIELIKKRLKFKGFNTNGEYVETNTGMFDSMITVFGFRPTGVMLANTLRPRYIGRGGA